MLAPPMDGRRELWDAPVVDERMPPVDPIEAIREGQADSSLLLRVDAVRFRRTPRASRPLSSSLSRSRSLPPFLALPPSASLPLPRPPSLSGVLVLAVHSAGRGAVPLRHPRSHARRRGQLSQLSTSLISPAGTLNKSQEFPNSRSPQATLCRLPALTCMIALEIYIQVSTDTRVPAIKMPSGRDALPGGAFAGGARSPTDRPSAKLLGRAHTRGG